MDFAYYSPLAATSFMPQVGQRLKDLRQLATLSQSQMAGRVGLDQSWISRMERGEVEDPSLVSMQRWLMLFRIGIDDLFGGEERWNEAWTKAQALHSSVPTPLEIWRDLPAQIHSAINAASMILIVGHMGSGKSTMLNAILAGIEPDHMDILGFSGGTAWRQDAPDTELCAGMTLSQARAHGHTLYDTFPLELERQTTIIDRIEASTAEVVIEPEIQGAGVFNNPPKGKFLGTFHAGSAEEAAKRIQIMQMQEPERMVDDIPRQWLQQGPLILLMQRAGRTMSGAWQIFPGTAREVAIHDVTLDGFIALPLQGHDPRLL